MKNQVILYRIEDESRAGMFINRREVFISHNTDIYPRHNKMKPPEQEGLDIRKDRKEWKCGYKSDKQLESFVKPSELLYLTTLGFKAFKITVSEFQEGNDQYLFTESSVIDKVDVTHQFL